MQGAGTAREHEDSARGARPRRAGAGTWERRSAGLESDVWALVTVGVKAAYVVEAAERAVEHAVGPAIWSAGLGLCVISLKCKTVDMNSAGPASSNISSNSRLDNRLKRAIAETSFPGNSFALCARSDQINRSSEVQDEEIGRFRAEGGSVSSIDQGISMPEWCEESLFRSPLSSPFSFSESSSASLMHGDVFSQLSLLRGQVCHCRRCTFAILIDACTISWMQLPTCSGESV